MRETVIVEAVRTPVGKRQSWQDLLMIEKKLKELG